jgi:plastocyanin
MHTTMKTPRVALALLALVAAAAPAAAVVSPLARAGSSRAGHDSAGSPGVAADRGSASDASSHTVVLKGLRFHPSTITIKRGESVTWVWRDGTEHNVTASGFHSRTQTHGSFTVRFTHAGTFNYHCTIHIHEGMVGKVIVR